MKQNSAPKTANYINQSLAEGLSVLDFFLAELNPLTDFSLKELEAKLGMDYAKLNRIVKTLHHAGYLDSDVEGRRFSVSKKLTQLTWKYLQKIKHENQRLVQEVLALNKILQDDTDVKSIISNEPTGC